MGRKRFRESNEPQRDPETIASPFEGLMLDSEVDVPTVEESLSVINGASPEDLDIENLERMPAPAKCQEKGCPNLGNYKVTRPNGAETLNCSGHIGPARTYVKVEEIKV